MTGMELGSVLVAHQTTLREVRSAFPTSPQQPHRATSRPRLYRTRFATATVLRRAASRVAPA